MISQILCSSLQIGRSSRRIPSMLHSFYKPHYTSQIPWLHTAVTKLYIPVKAVAYTVSCLQMVYTQ